MPRRRLEAKAQIQLARQFYRPPNFGRLGAKRQIDVPSYQAEAGWRGSRINSARCRSMHGAGLGPE